VFSGQFLSPCSLIEGGYNGLDCPEWSRKMTQLCGKGVWLAHSSDLERAVEMAMRIGGTHLLIKVGHGPYYFPEVTREMVRRVHTLGLYPLAWVQLTSHASQEAHKAVIESLTRGYEAVVLFLTPGRGVPAQLRALAEALINAEVPPQRLMLASQPLPYLQDRTALEALVAVCQGGWMPFCFPGGGRTAQQLIDQDVYHAMGDLSLIWGKTPEIYPVLSSVEGAEGEDLLPEAFIPWVEGIARHGVDFFSVYHTAGIEKVLWPMLQAVNVACLETGGRAAVAGGNGEVSMSINDPAVPQPVYVTVRTSDTVWGIISRHNLKREQFWTWNAHLWDSRGLPRDPDYLQEGWRIRVK
jgi:hypothetical protein